MSYEKGVLKLAKSVGLRGAYFSCGTMFVSPDTVSLPGMPELKKFLAQYRLAFPGKTLVTIGAEEIAVDFIV